MKKPILEDCTGVLLCGGKSRRMGFDKAFLQLDGHYLLPVLAKALENCFGRVLAVCDNPAKFAKLPPFAALPLAQDKTPETGPLGGLCTAFESASTPWLFVMACDMPRLDIDILYKLVDLLQVPPPGPDVALCRHAGHLEPLFAFYHRRCLPVLCQQLQGEDKSLRGAFEKLHMGVLELSEVQAEAAFANLNTPGELAHWQVAAQKGGKNCDEDG